MLAGAMNTNFTFTANSHPLDSLKTNLSVCASGTKGKLPMCQICHLKRRLECIFWCISKAAACLTLSVLLNVEIKRQSKIWPERWRVALWTWSEVTDPVCVVPVLSRYFLMLIWSYELFWSVQKKNVWMTVMVRMRACVCVRVGILSTVFQCVLL